MGDRRTPPEVRCHDLRETKRENGESQCNRVQYGCNRARLSALRHRRWIRSDRTAHRVAPVRSGIHSAVNESLRRPKDQFRTSSESQESQAQSLNQFAQQVRLSLSKPDHRESKAQSSGRTWVEDEPTSFLGKNNWQKPETTLSSTPTKRRWQRHAGCCCGIACSDVTTMTLATPPTAVPRYALERRLSL